MHTSFSWGKNLFFPITLLSFILYLAQMSIASATNALLPIFGSIQTIQFLKAFQALPDIVLILFLLIYSFKKPLLPLYMKTLTILGALLGLAALLLFFQVSLHWLIPFKGQELKNSYEILLQNFPAAIYIIIGRLFSINLISLFIWGFVNQISFIEEGKKFFMPLAFVLGVLFNCLQYTSAFFIRFGVFALTVISLFLLITVGLIFKQIYLRLPEDRKERFKKEEKVSFSFPYLSAGFFIASGLMASHIISYFYRLTARNSFPNPVAYSEHLGSFFAYSAGFTSLLAITWLILGIVLLKKRGLVKVLSLSAWAIVCGLFVSIIFLFIFNKVVFYSFLGSFFKATHLILLYPLVQILYLFLPFSVRFTCKIVVEMIFVSIYRALASLAFVGYMIASGASATPKTFFTLLLGVIGILAIYATRRLIKYKSSFVEN